MVKIVGAVIIIVSASMYGVIRYENYRIRPRALGFFIGLLQSYQMELEWNRRSIPEMMRQYSDQRFSEYISAVKINLASMPLKDAFIDKNDQLKSIHLKDEDISILRGFFTQSGAAGVDNEAALCKTTLNALSLQQQNAQEELKKQGPFVLKMAVICGVWIVVMLL